MDKNQILKSKWRNRFGSELTLESLKEKHFYADKYLVGRDKYSPKTCFGGSTMPSLCFVLSGSYRISYNDIEVGSFEAGDVVLLPAGRFSVRVGLDGVEYISVFDKELNSRILEGGDDSLEPLACLI